MMERLLAIYYLGSAVGFLLPPGFGCKRGRFQTSMLYSFFNGHIRYFFLLASCILVPGLPVGTCSLGGTHMFIADAVWYYFREFSELSCLRLLSGAILCGA